MTANSSISSSLRPLHQHDVHLQRREPRRLGGVHGVEDRREIAALADRPEPVGPEGVAAHVHPPEPRGRQCGRTAGQAHPVGGHGEVIEPDGRQPGHQVGEPPAHQRLATGEPDGGDPEGSGHPCHPDDLVEREQGRPGQERHAFLGHAVDAAQVAPVGDRDAQVVVDPSVGVDQWPRQWAWPRARGPGPAAGPRWRQAPTWSPRPGLSDGGVGNQPIGVGEDHVDDPTGLDPLAVG